MIRLLSRSDSMAYQTLPSDAQETKPEPIAPFTNPGLDLTPFIAAASEVSKLVNDALTCLRMVKEKQEESKRTESVEVFQSLSKDVWEEMSSLTKLAKDIRSRINALANDNAVNLKYPDCGPGSPIERARTNITSELKVRLQGLVIEFSNQKEDLEDDHHLEFHPEVAKHLQGVEEQRLQEVAENPTQFLDFASYMQNRNESVKQVNSNLNGLMQMFSDMVVVVDAQKNLIDSIETQVLVSVRDIEEGNKQLKKAERSHRCATMLKLRLAICLIVFIVLFIFLLPNILNLIKLIEL